MALQLTFSNTNYTAWLKKSAVKTMCLVVAGLLFTAMLYNRASTDMYSQQHYIPTTKQSHACPGISIKDKQASDASPLSLMPGGLTRFLR